MQLSPIRSAIIIFILLTTVWIFINTVITKRWRNRAPDESKSWRLGFIYYNPPDKRIFLPKRTGLGMTFNFARPASIIMVSAIILFCVVYLIIF